MGSLVFTRLYYVINCKSRYVIVCFTPDDAFFFFFFFFFLNVLCPDSR